MGRRHHGLSEILLMSVKCSDSVGLFWAVLVLFLLAASVYLTCITGSSLEM